MLLVLMTQDEINVWMTAPARKDLGAMPAHFELSFDPR